VTISEGGKCDAPYGDSGGEQKLAVKPLGSGRRVSTPLNGKAGEDKSGKKKGLPKVAVMRETAVPLFRGSRNKGWTSAAKPHRGKKGRGYASLTGAGGKKHKITGRAAGRHEKRR